MIKSLIREWDYITLAMSTSKQDLLTQYHNIYGSRIGKKSFECHLGKVILYGHKDNNIYDEHWSTEIFNFLDNISDFKLKPYNRRPESRFIRDNFFFYIMDDEETFKRRLEKIEKFCMQDKEKPYPKGKKVKWTKAWTLYKEFAENCSKDISKDGEIKRSNFDKYLKPLFDCD